MKSATQNIPQSLVYEMVNGQAIYYKGYKSYLKGEKSVEQLMGSSKLQSYIITELLFLIRSFLGKDYFIFSNEIGLQFSKNTWRAADLAVLKKDKSTKIDSKYLNKAPELVIEIDTKADLSDVQNPLGYYQEKTQELLDFGVQKTIWIFTDTKKIMLAEKGKKKWEIIDWDQEVNLFEGLSLNLKDLLTDLGDL
ncbi:MAG: Uma2 family endonuclease [Bacteroidota bacterium]